MELQAPLGIIFTFVWAFNLESDHKFVADIVKLFASKERRVQFVEWLASREARIAREGTLLRLSLKPAHRDLQKARAMHAELDAKYQMSSNGAFPYSDRYVAIDTEQQSPHQSAVLIQKHFGLPTAVQ